MNFIESDFSVDIFLTNQIYFDNNNNKQLKTFEMKQYFSFILRTKKKTLRICFLEYRLKRVINKQPRLTITLIFGKTEVEKVKKDKKYSIFC